MAQRKKAVKKKAIKKQNLAKKPRKKHPRKAKAKAPVVIGKMEPIAADRERWLARCAQLLHPLVTQIAAWERIPLQHRIPPQISCSWPAGRSSKILSQTVINEANQQPQISLSPLVGNGMQTARGESHSLRAALQILHELVHIAAGPNCGHREEFSDIALGVGFSHPLADAVATPDLVTTIKKSVLQRIGEYPHVAVVPDNNDTPGARRQKNRQRKYVCRHCDQIIRCAGEKLIAIHCCEDGKTGQFILVD